MKKEKAKNIIYSTTTKIIASVILILSVFVACCSGIIMMYVGEENFVSQRDLYEKFRDNVVSNYFAMLTNGSYSLFSDSENLCYAFIYTGNDSIEDVDVENKKGKILFCSEGYEPDFDEDNYFKMSLYKEKAYYDFIIQPIAACFVSARNNGEDYFYEYDEKNEEMVRTI